MHRMIFACWMLISAALSRPAQGGEVQPTQYSLGPDSLIFVGETDNCSPAQISVWWKYRPVKRRVFGEDHIFMCRCWMLTCKNVVLQPEQLWQLSRLIWPYTDDIYLPDKVTKFLEAEGYGTLEGERTYEL